MNVTAVGAPAPKVYEMMQQGVIDGVFIPMGEQKSQRLKEVAKHVVALPGGMYLGSFAMFISPEFMDGLSKKDQEAIRAVSGEKLSAMAGAAWDAADKEGLEAALADGVSVNQVAVDGAMAQEFRELVKGMDEEWFALVEDRGVDAKAALEEMREIARSYDKK